MILQKAALFGNTVVEVDNSVRHLRWALAAEVLYTARAVKVEAIAA